MELLIALGVWNWVVVGGILLALEIIAPGAFMLWLGLSAILVGAISLVFPWPWQAQLIAFGVFAMGSIPLWRDFSPPGEPAGGSAVPHPPPPRGVWGCFLVGKAHRRRVRP